MPPQSGSPTVVPLHVVVSAAVNAVQLNCSPFWFTVVGTKRTGMPPTVAFAGAVAVKANTPELVFVQVPATAPVAVQIWPTTVAHPMPGVPETTGVSSGPVVGVLVRVGVFVTVGVNVTVGVVVGVTMLTITCEVMGVPAALLATLARLIAEVPLAAVVLTRKFSTACPPVPVQVTEPTKPGAGFGVTAPQPSPFWNTRPACHWSVKPCR